MQFEYGNCVSIGQCFFCLKWKKSCEFIKLKENNLLPYPYRTLYTFKQVVCPDCKGCGEEYLGNKARHFMDEYIGRVK
jgi:hypothetical protein